MPVRQLPEILVIFLAYQILGAVLVRLPPSLWLSPKQEDLDARQRRRLSRRVLGLVHSCVVVAGAFRLMVMLTLGQHGQFATALERATTPIEACSTLQSLMLGYELWEALALASHPEDFPAGTLAHCVLNAMVWIVTMRPTANYYVPGFIMCQSSSIFLDLHWVLDQRGDGDKRMARVNDGLLWLCFVGFRLCYFPVHASRMVHDGITMWAQHNHSVFPHWLLAVYVFLPVSLGILNVYWFSKLVRSGRFDPWRRAEAPCQAGAAPVDLEQLRAAWAAALQKDVKEILDMDNFFLLGGDSMAALQMLNAAAKSNIRLTARIIMTNPTLEAMALAATTMSANAHAMAKPFACLGYRAIPARFKAASLCGIGYRAVQDIYPCATFQALQMALGAHHRSRFRLRVSYHCKPELELVRFKAAFETLVANNPILRTRIVQLRPGAFVQVVTSENITWHEYDSMDAYLAEVGELHMTYGRALTHYAFVKNKDKPDGPPTFVWMAHHAVFDGWSIKLLLEELSALYEGAAPTHFHPFGQVMVDWYRRGAAESVAYWATELDSAQPTLVPGVSPSFSGTTDSQALRSVTRAGIDAALRRTPGLKLATVLGTAWAIAMAELIGTDDNNNNNNKDDGIKDADVIYSLVLSGRNSATDGVQRTVGPTISSVPVRTRLPASQPVAALLAAKADQDVAMMPHEQFPVGQLRKSHPQALRVLGSHSTLIIHPRGKGYRDVPGVLGQLGTVEVHRMGFSKPLVLEFFLETDRIGMCLHYDKTVLDAARMETALRQVEVALCELVEAPTERTIADVRANMRRPTAAA